MKMTRGVALSVDVDMRFCGQQMTVHTTCSHYIQQSPYPASLVDTDFCPDENVHHISVAILTCNVEWSSAILSQRYEQWKNTFCIPFSTSPFCSYIHLAIEACTAPYIGVSQVNILLWVGEGEGGTIFPPCPSVQNIHNYCTYCTSVHVIIHE